MCCLLSSSKCHSHCTWVTAIRRKRESRDVKKCIHVTLLYLLCTKRSEKERDSNGMQILQLSSTVSRLRSPRTCTKHGEKNRYHFLFFVVFPFISTFMMGFCNSFLPFIDTVKAFTPCTHKPNANVSIMAFSENLSVRDLLRASIRYFS